MAYLWGWFIELASARTSNGFGLNPISYVEIAAWARLTGREPSPWEVSLLKRMDGAALAAYAKKAPGAKAPPREIKPDDWQALDRALDRMG